MGFYNLISFHLQGKEIKGAESIEYTDIIMRWLISTRCLRPGLLLPASYYQTAQPSLSIVIILGCLPPPSRHTKRFCMFNELPMSGYTHLMLKFLTYTLLLFDTVIVLFDTDPSYVLHILLYNILSVTFMGMCLVEDYYIKLRLRWTTLLRPWLPDEENWIASRNSAPLPTKIQHKDSDAVTGMLLHFSVWLVSHRHSQSTYRLSERVHKKL